MRPFLTAIRQHKRLILGLMIYSLVTAGIVILTNQSRLPPQPTPTPAYSAVTLPPDYRTRFVKYLTVDRKDGTVRDLYINPEALAQVQIGRRLPEHTIIVIEGYHALEKANGTFVTDEAGHFVKGEPLDMIHVLEKRADWSGADFVSDQRMGDWNFGTFDIHTGAHYNESVNACFNCHRASAGSDFVYSYGQLIEYSLSGQTQYFYCNLGDRIACT